MHLLVVNSENIVFLLTSYREVHRTGKLNEAMALSHLIISKLKGKKMGQSQ